MVTKKKKETTIDDLALEMREGFEDLARMTAKGFAQVDKRFEQVENRLGNVEDRLGKVEDRLGTVEGELSALRESNTLEHEGTTTRLNNAVYRFELIELDKRVRSLEKKVK